MTKKEDISSVLEARAALLAKPEVKHSDKDNHLLLCFSVHDEKYAIDEQAISKVIAYQPVTPLPLTDSHFEGVLYYSGFLWPVLDAGLFFQNKRTGEALHLVLLQNDTLRLVLGCHAIIDQVAYHGKKDIVALETKQMHQHRYIKGLINNDIALIDHNKLLGIGEQHDNT